jgi:hypothetical protein
MGCEQWFHLIAVKDDNLRAVLVARVTVAERLPGAPRLRPLHDVRLPHEHQRHQHGAAN